MYNTYVSEQWEKVGTLPNDCLEFITDECQISIKLDELDEYYISIVAIDKHGAEIGKENGFYSNEIYIHNR